jgi:nucleotide-binding universal stress UspA family protein
MDPIESILVPTDFCPRSEAAALRALTLALPYEAAIHLVHAVRFPALATPYYDVAVPDAVWDAARSAARTKMEAARKAVEQRGVSTVTGEVHEFYDPVQVIVETVEKRQPNLIAMGTHGRSGLQHLTLGSIAERTLRQVSCPVLAVKEEVAHATDAIEKILLAVDFSADSDLAVEAARELGARLGASVDVVHAFDLPADCFATLDAVMTREIERKSGQLLEALKESLEGECESVTVHLRRGAASVVISDEAERLGSNLIVMGRRGQSGLSHLLIGSVAERTLRRAPCSVLTVRSDAS